eukprot:94432-Pleurochrysis_carterae.AAC.1
MPAAAPQQKPLTRNSRTTPLALLTSSTVNCPAATIDRKRKASEEPIFPRKVPTLLPSPAKEVPHPQPTAFAQQQ